jgi:hypothetical protein
MPSPVVTPFNPNFQAIKDALAGWVTAVAFLPAYWRGTKEAGINWRPTLTPQEAGYFLLNISGFRTVGRDDLVYSDDSTVPGEEIEYYTFGQRVFTFSAQARTWMQNHDNAGFDFQSIAYTNMLRNALRLPIRSRAVFSAVEIAFNTVLSEVELPTIQDGREMSVSQIDIAFNCHGVALDTATGYIATVDDAELEVPEGNVVWTGDIEVE